MGDIYIVKAKARINVSILTLVTIALTAAFILGAVAPFAWAATSSQTLTVTVNVSTTTTITVAPTSLTWNLLSLGTAGSSSAVDVKNSGSTNLTSLYVSGDALTQEASRPYGTGVPGNYAAASVLKIANQSASTYYWVGRIEWNWTDSISNLQATGVNSLKSWGFYKNASSEFVWAAGNGTDGGASFGCNETGAQFKISPSVDIGTAATRTTSVAGSPVASDANYGYFTVGADPLNGYCVAVNTACTKIYIYKFDNGAGFSSCTGTSYLTTPIYPGDIARLSLEPVIPNGVPNGNFAPATLTFTAST